jgi:hypothetical protein
MDDGRHPSWTGGWHWATAVYKVLGGTKPIPADGAAPSLTRERTASP